MLRMLASVLGRIDSRRPAHHQTRAGYHAAFMRFDNAAINSGTLAEIIRIHDQVFIRSHSPQFQIQISQNQRSNLISLFYILRGEPPASATETNESSAIP